MIILISNLIFDILKENLNLNYIFMKFHNRKVIKIHCKKIMYA